MISLQMTHTRNDITVCRLHMQHHCVQRTISLGVSKLISKSTESYQGRSGGGKAKRKKRKKAIVIGSPTRECLIGSIDLTVLYFVLVFLVGSEGRYLYYFV